MGEVYSHLSEEERQVIQIEVGNGASIRGIGAMLGRSPSSISREIKRNTWFPSNENESYRPYRPKRLKAGPWTGRYYIAGPAQRKADRRRSKPRKPYRLSHDRLWAQVAEWLGRGWSPLLISGRLRVLWPDDALMRVCPETIYRWVYSSRPLRERWARCLPRGHRRRRRHGGRRTSRFPIPGRVPISERPPEADGRSAFGHWEADSVIGVGCNLHTEVERRTRFLMARVVPDKTAGESVGAQLDMFSPLPAGARVSVTHDNGTEFAHHERLRDGLGMATYFADPYSSWQRGSNENRNGMIRRYLPKRCEIRMDMAKEIREIVDEINNRPMRVLGYRTPAEAFADELLELQDQQGCCTSKWTSGIYRRPDHTVWWSAWLITGTTLCNCITTRTIRCSMVRRRFLIWPSVRPNLACLRSASPTMATCMAPTRCTPTAWPMASSPSSASKLM